MLTFSTHKHTAVIEIYKLCDSVFKRFLALTPAITCIIVFQLLNISSAQAQQVDYKPLYTEESFNNRALDINLPVGTMAGEAGVANGAAIYHIPIVVPPGTNGVAPALSINYNSMAGNGILGRGWSLSGLSSISRVPGRLFYDDDVFPVNFDANDRFSLDGQHLIGLTGTYGTNGAIYGTEVEDYAVITSHDIFGTGPLYFTVESKHGIVLEYGRTLDARVLSNDNQQILEWKLNKLTMPDGNYIIFKYLNNGKYISTAQYTYNDQNDDFLGTVNFNYMERQDKNTVYTAGSAYTFDLLLTSIVTNAEGQNAGSYHFEYGFQESESYLVGVEQRGIDGIGFNSTIFRYGNNSVNIEVDIIDLSGYSSDNWKLSPGDFYANGFSDLLAIKSDETETTLRILRNNESSLNPGFSMAVSETIPHIMNLYSNYILPNYNITYSSDFYGDGRSDIILCNTIPTTDGPLELKAIRFYHNPANPASDPNLFSFNSFHDHPWPSITSEGAYKYFNPEENFMIQGDFDGDGRMDFIVILSKSTTEDNQYKAFLSFPGKTPDNLNMEYNVITTPNSNDDYLQGLWQKADYYNVIDFTGDGRHELMITKGNETGIYRLFENSGNWEAEELYNSDFPTKNHNLYFGDFNGDGKSDFLFRLNNQWGIAHSTGINFIQSFLNGSLAPNLNDPEVNCGNQIFITDVSGNGKSDIVQFNTLINKGDGELQTWDECYITDVKIIYSNGDNYYSETILLQDSILVDNGYLPNMINGYDVQNYFLPLSCLSDGRVNFLFGLKMHMTSKVLTLNIGEHSHLLKATKNGLNKESTWKYQRMTESGAYTRDAITSYPVNTIRAPLSLVQEFTSLPVWTQYAYKNARLHRLKGLLGFESVTTTDSPKDARIIQYQAYDPEMEALLPVLTESYRKKWNGQYELIQDVTLDFDIENLGAKRYKMQLTQKTVNNYLSGSTLIEQILDYDNYGNPTEIETDINGIETVTVSLQYDQFGTPVPAHVVSSTTTTTRTGQAPFAVETIMDYNNYDQLIEKVDFASLTKKFESNYEYNNNGTLANKSVTSIGSNGPETRTSTYDYDNYGRFLESSENALNQTTFVATHDPRNGNVLSYTDMDGLQTTYEYDGFGRLLKTVDVSKNYEVQKTLAWSINSTLKSMYKHSIHHPGQLNSTSYFDVLGRNVKKEAPGFVGTFLPPPVGSFPLAPLSQQLTSYGSDGNVYMQTRPHYQGEDAMPVTNDYDEYGRVWFVNSDYGETEYEYSYSNGDEIVTVTLPSGQSKITRTDATGKVIQVSDNGGTLNYEYFSHGGLRKVIQGGTTLVEMEYDEYGRQTKLIDGSAGTILYEYDGFGQLISQTNAKNEVQTMEYDLLSRLVLQTMPEGSIQYTYKNNAPGINLPEQVLGIDGGETHYSYDNFGRIASVEEIIDGESFTMHFEYDKYDRLKKRIFPTGYALRYFYDSNGNLSHIFSDDMQTQFYTAYETNGQGQMVNWTAGNGKS
jgi:YD repeat-containing protein